jgi:hypothetical protein
VFALLGVGLLAFTGCKREQPPPQATSGHYGLNVDVARLDTEFATAAPEVQQHVGLLKHAFRYSQWPQAAAELDELGNNPDLTPAQKKLIEDLKEQTRQAITNTPASAGQ